MWRNTGGAWRRGIPPPGTKSIWHGWHTHTWYAHSMSRPRILPTLLVCLCPLSARGAVIFDALEPHCCATESIYRFGLLRHSIGFRTTGLYELTSVSFNLIGPGGLGDLVVEIYSDSGATYHTPGSLVASYAVPMPVGVVSIVEAPAPAGIFLQPDQIYWIAPSTMEWWNVQWWYNLEVNGFRAAQRDGIWYSACGASNDCSLLGTRVEGDAVVPEPATSALCGLLAITAVASRSWWNLRRPGRRGKSGSDLANES